MNNNPLGCKPQDDPDLQLREKCFKWKNEKWSLRSVAGCETANYVEKDGKLFQTGGPIKYKTEEDRAKGPCNNQHQTFAMPFEAGFVIDFDIDDENIPKGCGPLNEPFVVGK